MYYLYYIHSCVTYNYMHTCIPYNYQHACVPYNYMHTCGLYNYMHTCITYITYIHVLLIITCIHVFLIINTYLDMFPMITCKCSCNIAGQANFFQFCELNFCYRVAVMPCQLSLYLSYVCMALVCVAALLSFWSMFQLQNIFL